MGCAVDVGDLIQPSFHVVDPVTGFPANPGSVTCLVRKPDGSVHSITPVVHPSVGEFHVNFAPDTPGQYWFRFDGSVGVTASQEGSFLVRRPRVAV